MIKGLRCGPQHHEAEGRRPGCGHAAGRPDPLGKLLQCQGDMTWAGHWRVPSGCHGKVLSLHCCTRHTRQICKLILHEVEAAHPKLLDEHIKWCYAKMWAFSHSVADPCMATTSSMPHSKRLACFVVSTAYILPEIWASATAAAAVVSRCSSVGRAPDCRLVRIYRMVTGSIPVIEMFWFSTTKKYVLDFLHNSNI